MSKKKELLEINLDTFHVPVYLKINIIFLYFYGKNIGSFSIIVLDNVLIDNPSL